MDKSAVTVALLAAGKGKRFGGDKLDAPCAGRPLGCWVVEAVEAAGLDPGICVTGPTPPEFLQHLKDWSWVINPAPEVGIGSSIASAARLATYRGSEGLLVLLADMPLLDPTFLKQLVACNTPAAADYGRGKPGTPALFPASLFPVLRNLSGETGASAQLRRIPDLQKLKPPAGMLLDVDTPEDLAKAETILREREAS